MKYTGTVYLLHFDTPLAHARHYLGWTAGDVEDRLEEHRTTMWSRLPEPQVNAEGKRYTGIKTGNGANLMGAVNAAGITWQLAQTWRGTRNTERRLKNRKHASRFCPICKKEHSE